MTRPLNEQLLWKGKIQLSKYPPSINKGDMNLLPCGKSPIDGAEFKRLQNKYCDPDGLVKGYAEYSKKYWEGVERRKIDYRLNALKQ